MTCIVFYYLVLFMQFCASQFNLHTKYAFRTTCSLQMLIITNRTCPKETIFSVHLVVS